MQLEKQKWHFAEPPFSFIGVVGVFLEKGSLSTPPTLGVAWFKNIL